MPQYGRPNSDIDNEGAWSPSSGSTLYPMLDEPLASDSDLIEAHMLATADSCTIGLSTVTDPASSADHYVSYRYRKSNSSGSSYKINIYLQQGASTIASWQHTALGTSWLTAVQLLSGSQADTSTNYSDLRLLIIATRTSGGSGANVQLSWAEIEVPDVATGGFNPAWATQSNQVIA